MAIFRNVNMSFWTDTKVVDDYTPEDKYFMLYALTNNYTNIIGCYEISIKQMSNDLGYTKDVVESLLRRFITHHKTIDYDFNTKELMVINWNKYNWSSSPKLDSPLFAAIENVKSDKFHDMLANIYNQRESINKGEDTVSIPYRYGIDTTITITNTIPITNSISTNINNIETIEENKKTPKKQSKKSYGEYKRIKLTDKEYEKLCNDFSKSVIDNQILLLDEYVESNNNKNNYSNFNLVLRKSIRENWFKLKTAPNNNYRRKEIVPDWMNKKIEEKPMTKEQQKEMDKVMKELDDVLNERVEKLKERLNS